MLWDYLFGPGFVILFFVSFIVFVIISQKERESWLLFFNCFSACLLSVCNLVVDSNLQIRVVFSKSL